MRTWKNQFPTESTRGMGDIARKLEARGFTDCSWGNDICPKWQDERGYTVWVDFEDRELREFPSSDRFQLTIDDKDGDTTSLASSNDIDEVLAKYDGISPRPEKELWAKIRSCGISSVDVEYHLGEGGDCEVTQVKATLEDGSRRFIFNPAAPETEVKEFRHLLDDLTQYLVATQDFSQHDEVNGTMTWLEGWVMNECTRTQKVSTTEEKITRF